MKKRWDKWQAPLLMDTALPISEEEQQTGLPEMGRMIRKYEFFLPGLALICLSVTDGFLKLTCWLWPPLLCLGITVLASSLSVRNHRIPGASSDIRRIRTFFMGFLIIMTFAIALLILSHTTYCKVLH